MSLYSFLGGNQTQTHSQRHSIHIPAQTIPKCHQDVVQMTSAVLESPPGLVPFPSKAAAANGGVVSPFLPAPPCLGVTLAIAIIFAFDLEEFVFESSIHDCYVPGVGQKKSWR